MSEAEQYARDVIKGKVIAGNHIKKACERFLSDLKRKDLYFDEAEGNKPILFGERYCMQWEGKWRGKAVVFELWQKFIIQQIYGWFWKDSGLRRVRKVYVQVAKKNGKSTLSGIIANYHLFADERINTPKVFAGANNEEQAKIPVNMAGRIIEQSPTLFEYVLDKTVHLFNYKENIVNILHKDRDGFIKALPKESANNTDQTAGGKHGLNPSLGIIDEYAMADSDGVLGALQTGMGSRDEPLIFCITTAGFKQNGPCYTQLRRVGIDILEGRSEDDTYLPFIYEMDEKDDIADEKVWAKANPNLGVSVANQFLRAQLSEAKLYGGSKEVEITTLNFNKWCEAFEVWVPGATWKRNSHGIKDEDLIGRPCFTGYDFAARVDICAVAAYFPGVKEVNSKPINAVRWWFWMPESKVKNNKERVDYSKWVDQGLIETIPGDTIEWEYIIEKMKSELPKYDHQSGAYDPYLATNGVIQGLTKEGLILNPIGQGFAAISEPTKEWERLLTNNQIDHMNNPVAEWMNKNTTIIRDANRNIKIQKIDGEKGALKIDGIAAAINALAQSMSEPPKQSGFFLIEDDFNS